MKTLYIIAMMVALMATPGFALGKTMRDAVGVCPDGTEKRIAVECEAGKQVVVKMTCGTQSATFRVDCPDDPPPIPSPVPEKPLRAFLVLDVGLGAGALGYGQSTTGIGLFRLGVEFTLAKKIGLLFEGRMGVAGKLFKQQPGNVSSYWGGVIYLTWRPADSFRLAFGGGGFSTHTSSWTRLVSGAMGSVRADWMFAKYWSVGLFGDLGYGWDPCRNGRFTWMAGAGISFVPPVSSK